MNEQEAKEKIWNFFVNNDINEIHANSAKKLTKELTILHYQLMIEEEKNTITMLNLHEFNGDTYVYNHLKSKITEYEQTIKQLQDE